MCQMDIADIGAILARAARARRRFCLFSFVL